MGLKNVQKGKSFKPARSGLAKTQNFKASKTQNFKAAKPQNSKNFKTPKSQNIKTQNLKTSKTRNFKDPKLQKLKTSKCQNLQAALSTEGRGPLPMAPGSTQRQERGAHRVTRNVRAARGF